MAFSVADFYLDDAQDPLAPSLEFRDWQAATRWASSLYERSLLGAPLPRARIETSQGPRQVINLASYNYLGLATHPEVVAAAQHALSDYGTGACGSPMLSGMTDLHRNLEKELAAFLGYEETMLFSSGFGGALGALAGVLRRGDVALVDDRVHQSLTDGARLSQATCRTFAHNDPDALDEALRAAEGRRRVIAVDGIYSMDGDLGDLPALLEVAERHGVSLLVDEAHSVLTTGPRGGGVVQLHAAEARVALYYGTFSKAFAGVGGFLAGSAGTLNYLRMFANTYGFSCALPPSVVAGLRAALSVAIREPALRERLQDNAVYFRAGLHRLGLNTGASATQVVPIIIGSERTLLYELGHELLDRGVYLAPVDFPSVPEDQVRFRASITAAHTRQDLDEALNIIGDTVTPRLRAAA